MDQILSILRQPALPSPYGLPGDQQVVGPSTNVQVTSPIQSTVQTSVPGAVATTANYGHTGNVQHQVSANPTAEVPRQLPSRAVPQTNTVDTMELWHIECERSVAST